MYIGEHLDDAKYAIKAVRLLMQYKVAIKLAHLHVRAKDDECSPEWLYSNCGRTFFVTQLQWFGLNNSIALNTPRNTETYSVFDARNESETACLNPGGGSSTMKQDTVQSATSSKIAASVVFCFQSVVIEFEDDPFEARIKKNFAHMLRERQEQVVLSKL